MNSLSISRMDEEFTMNSLSASQFLFEFTIGLANSLSLSRIHLESFLCHQITMNALSVSHLTINIFSISLFVSPIHLQSTILFATSRWIYYPFHFITVYALPASGFYYKSTISFVISLWIHYHFREINVNSLSVSRIDEEFTMNSLSASRFLFEFTFSAKSLWIHYLIPEITMNALFAKSIWIYYFLRDFTENSPKILHFFRLFTICFANSPWIHFLVNIISSLFQRPK